MNTAFKNDTFMTLTTRLATGVAATALLTTAALAQDDETRVDIIDETIVVTGSFVPRPAQEVGSAVSIVDQELLDASQNVVISDILRTVPGLAVNRTGPQGALTQVRIRGAEGNHTLVYIDGIEAANPVFGEFNFANLVSADVERIEIIRGPQSALYGSEAIGGVISVFTKDAEEGVQAEFEAEAGSFGTYRVFGALGAGTQTMGLRGSVQYYSTDGISTSPSGDEEDGFQNLTASLKGFYRPSERWGAEAVFRISDSEADGDQQEFAFGTVVDAPLTTEAQDILAKLDITGDILGDWLKGRAFVTYTDGENNNFDRGTQTTTNEGQRLKYGANVTALKSYDLFDHTLTVAVEREELEFENTNQARDDDQTSIIGEYTVGYDDSLFLAAAVRQDFNNEFDDATTYRLSAAYLLNQTGTRFHASWGEGITDPTFNERFGFNPDTFIGNPDLVPESSQGWDIGVEQSFFGGRAIVDVTYFSANLEDEISTSFAFIDGQFFSSPINNPGESERDGVEVMLTADLWDNLSLDAQYTYLDATGADELVEVRRPEHTASANLVYTSDDGRITLNLGADYNGEQEDLFFGFADPNFTPRKTLDSYTLVRIAGTLRVTDRFELFARGENVFDADYTEVLGFNTVGAAGYVGARLAY